MPILRTTTVRDDIELVTSMTDSDCIAFLQWALPQLDLYWPGFRKVRRQVCKRLKRRTLDLGLGDFYAYRARLETDPSEWRAFDECCHVTISRFFRDRAIFEAMRDRYCPISLREQGMKGATRKPGRPDVPRAKRLTP